VADSVDSVKGVPVFNRVTTLKDSWGKWFKFASKLLEKWECN
jgi:hypothetical protein